MKIFNIYLLIITLMSITCSEKSEKKDVSFLEEGSRSYSLIRDIATLFPSLDLDASDILAKSKVFKVTAGEAIHELRLNMGLDSEKVKKLSPNNLKNLIEDSARKVAENKLLLYEAEKSGIKISEPEITEALNRQYVQAGSEEKFLELITKNGLNMEYVKNDIWKNLMIHHYIEEKIYNKIQISVEEIRLLYNEYKTASIRHIFLSTEKKEVAEKQEIREKMEEILKRAERGESFAELAKRYSQDLRSKDKGGLYDMITPGYLEKPLDEVAFKIPVGEISDIIETPLGYHIVKVIERKKETRPFEEVRNELDAKIRIEKQWKAYHSYLEELKHEFGLRIMSLKAL